MSTRPSSAISPRRERRLPWPPSTRWKKPSDVWPSTLQAVPSPRNVRELDLPGMRSWVVTGFPYLVSYVEREADIDVWRVLHAARDIPAWLQEPLED